MNADRSIRRRSLTHRGDDMKPTPPHRPQRGWIVAVLLFAIQGADAASGYTVTEQQEQQIKVGMRAADVERILGRPMQNIKYPNARGPMWFYDVVGLPVPTVFEIAFDADGNVVSAREYPDLSRNSGP
jgi:outer membrane protein assembly factor BamE (lipoprotein component of BamABCDE complex)